MESTLDATSNIRLTGNFSLQHSIDQTTGLDAGMAPHRRLFVLADWRFAPLWQVGTKANYVADRMREPGDTRPKIPDYTLVDLNLRRDSFAGNWDMSAMVTNLFDRNAMEPTFQSVGDALPICRSRDALFTCNSSTDSDPEGQLSRIPFLRITSIDSSASAAIPAKSGPVS